MPSAFETTISEFNQLSHSPEAEPFVVYEKRLLDFLARIPRKDLSETEFVYTLRTLRSHIFSEAIAKGESTSTRMACLNARDELGYQHIDEQVTVYLMLAYELLAEDEAAEAERLVRRVHGFLLAETDKDQFVARAIHECELFLQKLPK